MISLSFDDSLPFCPLIFTGDVPDGYFKGGISQAKMDRWSKRVKSWKLTAPGGGSIDSLPVDPEDPTVHHAETDGFEGDAYEPRGGGVDNTVEEEKELVCGVQSFYRWLAVDSSSSEVSDNYAFVSFEITFNLFQGANRRAAYNPETKLWHPAMNITLRIYAENNGPAGFEIFAPATDEEVEAASDSGTIAGTVDEEAFEMKWAMLGITDGSPSFPSSITFEPTDFFPWDPGDGAGARVNSSDGSVTPTPD